MTTHRPAVRARSLRSSVGQTTTEYLMIMGLITSVFIAVNNTMYTPFHLMMQNLLQCIADGTVNEMACSGGASGLGTMPATNPLSSFTQSGQSFTIGVSNIVQSLGSGGTSYSVAGGSGEGGGSGSEIGSVGRPPNFNIERSTGTPVNSARFQSTEGASGAYYRKVESVARTSTTGIRAVATLPTFRSDPTRQNDDPKLGKTGPMDRPSMYMGAHAETTIDGVPVSGEADIGLQYTRRFDSQNRPTYVARGLQNAGTRPTDDQLYYLGEDGEYYNQRGERYTGDKNGLVAHFTYTPFARLNEPALVNGRVTRNAKGEVAYDNRYVPLSPPADQDRYFYPGERVEMSVQRSVGQNGGVTFSVQRDGAPPQEYTIDSVVLSRADADVSVKRVTSIDQYVWLDGSVQSAESRKPPSVDPTTATLSGAVWERVTVYDGATERWMTGGEFRQVVPRDPGNRVNEGQTFNIGSPTSKGGETISITPRTR